MKFQVEVPETEGKAIEKMKENSHFARVLNMKAGEIKMDKFSYLRRRLGKDIKVEHEIGF
jgi:ribosomal protein L19